MKLQREWILRHVSGPLLYMYFLFLSQSVVLTGSGLSLLILLFLAGLHCVKTSPTGRQ